MRLTKRQFLKSTAAATVTLSAWSPWRAAAAIGGSARWRLDLNGTWEAAQAGETDWIKGTVPGCIHTDLLAAGKIPDPYFRDNEARLQWVGEKNWLYRRKFQVPGSVIKFDRVLLRCEGLDTLAIVKINDREAGAADNMFRLWEFDAKPFLRPGENTIEILFNSPLPVMKAGDAKRHLYEWIGTHETAGRAWVRKEPCNFGWDWGPVLITCGIWRNISLEALNCARLQDVLITQDHSVANLVTLNFQIATDTVSPRMPQAVIVVRQQGKTAGQTMVNLPDGSGRASLVITNPKLWWPAGMGEANLYDVQVELRDAGGRMLDTFSRRLGLRTLKVLPADEKSSLRFAANGVEFFSKGANWIPADTFANRVTTAQLRRYVADAVAVNMNTLRFWGGGYYEDAALFDACDEMGICVWLDFKFACSSYPAFDDEFMQNVRMEARDQLRRLRDHPCIAVWCGNNEIGLMTKETWSDTSMALSDYNKLFKDLIGDQVKELAPQANYVTGSPDCGDTHYWAVWHGGKNFDAYRTQTGFMSEFGFQSFPEPRTVREFTNEEDRASVITPVMKWHQRSGDGNAMIREMITNYFNPPKDWESELWLSQITQAWGIKIGAEYWRQNMPKSMGCVFWQYNDCWPVVSWSSVDYRGRWKALHYLARRFYAPILVSGLEDAAKSAIDVYLTSDRLTACHGRLLWRATDAAGQVLQQDVLELDIPALRSQKIKTLDLRDVTASAGSDNVLVWLKVIVDREVASENLVFLDLPKKLKLQDPKIKTTVSKAGKAFRVTLSAEHPALWTWLSLDDEDARYSNNFVHLTGDLPAQIDVLPARPMSIKQFTQALRCRSLFDTSAPR